MSGVANRTNDDGDDRDARRAATLQKFPGENPILHESVQWWESTQIRLAVAGLIKTANGQAPDEALLIIDTDMSELPVLDVNHRDFERRNEVRLMEKKRNAVNRRKRYRIIMGQRTAVFSSLFNACEESAPMFARELREACDYARVGIEGGYFDGALAYRKVYAKLFAAKRSQADVEFYDTAKSLQKKSTLADGCKASDFMSKAYAWIHKIRPHLAQSYNDADAAEYIVQLMPRRLGADARRIHAKFEEEGKLGNLMELARELEKIVYADQSSTPAPPALVMLEQELSARYDMLALADMTGMVFVAAGAKPKASAGSGVQLMYGANGQWCSKCSSHSPCFLDPNWAGPLPVFLHKNTEKKKAIVNGRRENAKGASPPVTCQALKAPTQEAIKAYEERRRQQGGGRGRGRNAGGAAAEQVGGGAAIDFYASLQDITDVTLASMEDPEGIFGDADEEGLRLR